MPVRRPEEIPRYDSDNDDDLELVGEGELAGRPVRESDAKLPVEMVEEDSASSAGALDPGRVAEGEVGRGSIRLNPDEFIEALIERRDFGDQEVVVEGDVFIYGGKGSSEEGIEAFPKNLRVEGELTIIKCEKLTKLPDNLHVAKRLDILECGELKTLPDHLEVEGSMMISKNEKLTQLSDHLVVSGDVSISDCPQLRIPCKELEVGGNLRFERCQNVERLSKNIKVGEGISVADCENLTTISDKLDLKGDLYSRGCTHLKTLSKELKGGENIYLKDCRSLESLSDGLHVEGNILIEDGTNLKMLPSGLYVKGHLVLSGCTSLESLPDDFRVDGDLVLKDCENLTALPKNLQVGGSIILGKCTSLKRLPSGLRVRENLVISGCPSLDFLPDNLSVGKTLSFHQSSIGIFPSGLEVGGGIFLPNNHRLLFVEGLRVIEGDLILGGCTKLSRLREVLHVKGNLDLIGCTSLEFLPKGLVVDGNLDLTGCTSLKELPEGLTVKGDLILAGCTSLEFLPKGLVVEGNIDLSGCTSLRKELSPKEFMEILQNDKDFGDEKVVVKGDLSIIGDSSLKAFPDNVLVDGNLDLSGCTSLKELPQGLTVKGSLNLIGCTSLEALPRKLVVRGNLDLSGCTSLKEVLEDVFVEGDLTAKDCTSLKAIRKRLTVGGSLDLSGCTSLKELPEGLDVYKNLILKGCTSLEALPEMLWVDGNLDLSDCVHLGALPEGLSLGGEVISILTLSPEEFMGVLQSEKSFGFHTVVVKGDLVIPAGTISKAFPNQLHVEGNLHIEKDSNLETLFKNLRVDGNLFVIECSNIKTLAEELQIGKDLIILRNPMLQTIGKRVSVNGSLQSLSCDGITALADDLIVGQDIKIVNSPKLKMLPEGMDVGGDVELFQCPRLSSVPKGFAELGLKYDGQVRQIRLLDTDLSEEQIFRLREVENPAVSFQFFAQNDITVRMRDVETALDRSPFRVNRGELAKIQLPKISGETVMSSSELFEAFIKIFRSMETIDPTKPNYISYEVVTGDTREFPNVTNQELLKRVVIPRADGWIKTLYEIPLRESDIRPEIALKKEYSEKAKEITSFIVQKIEEEKDISKRTLLFSQLLGGMLVCSTGQLEALNAVAYSLMDLQQEAGIASPIRIIVAQKKNQAFTSAIVGSVGRHSQNVHLVAPYRLALAETLGLSQAVEGFVDDFARVGGDPFKKNRAVVAEAYYEQVTPKWITNWVEGAVETREDRELRNDLSCVEKAFNTLGKDAAGLDAQIETMSERAAKAEGQQQVNIERMVKTLRSQKDRIEVQKKEAEVELQRLAGKYDVSREDLVTHISERVKRNEEVRPLTTGDVLDYCNDKGLIQPGNENWWEGLFTADPIDDPLATPTPLVIEKILVDMGILIDERE